MGSNCRSKKTDHCVITSIHQGDADTFPKQLEFDEIKIRHLEGLE